MLQHTNFRIFCRLQHKKLSLQNGKIKNKIYLSNTNIIYAISNNINIGTIRETFFLNQISSFYDVKYPESGDFFVDGKYTFEIGGKNKSKKQIAQIENSFLALDDIEYGYKIKIPLWLFGFLY